MNSIPALILSSLLLVVPLVTLAGAEEGPVSPAVLTAPTGFSVLNGVPAESLSATEMEAVQGKTIFFTLTPSSSLPPSVPGVSLNLTAPAKGLNNVERAPPSRPLISSCINCFIIPG